MAFQVSPGVQVKEIDATSVVPAVSTSIGGFAGAFNWGPVEEVRLVSSEDNMASVFSTPDDNTAKYFLTAASFLKYGNALKIVRVVDSTANNASVAGDTTLLIKNEDSYDSTTKTLASQGAWIAKYPGKLGNSLKVEVCSLGSSFAAWTHAGQFDAAPGTSDFAKGLGKTSAADELHIAVIDEDGAFSGTPGTVLETFGFLSQGSDAKDSSGTSIYYKNVINNQSNYIWFGDHDVIAAEGEVAGSGLSDGGTRIADSDGAFANHTGVRVTALTAGVDGNSPTAGNIATGFDLLEDSETIDVNLLFAHPDANGVNTIAADLISIAETRKDCMAFISPPLADSVNSSTPATDVKEYADSLNSTSYASLDSGAVYVYDKYNDVYRWIGSAGLCAGLCANADNVADSWFSPAGVNRGQLLGVTKLAYNPTKAQRDELYKARVNPLVSFPGQGTMLFGDKTLLSRPSAFDRINVRRLFIVLEKAISTAAKAQLFEFNDEFTRAQFRNLLEPFLRDVKGRRGVTDFLVICDESNNTGQVIDSNRFVADIFIKPSRSINFITLNFIATRTGVDFSEVAGG
jgi:phage tail sheath protein FI